MIRSTILFISIFSALPLLNKAQSALPQKTIEGASALSVTRGQTVGDPLILAKKWQLHTYGGLSGSYSLFNRSNAWLLSAPVTLQLTHPLSRNLYAFAAVSAAPAYFNFSSFFLRTPSDKFSSMGPMRTIHPLGWTSRAEAGLFYINDEKTFSISGSFFMERSSYPSYLPYTPQRNPPFTR